MLLSLVSAASALSVPVRASITEEVVPGEDAVSSVSLTATVAVSDPATGATFAVSGDALTVVERVAEGEGGLTFAGDPAGTLRTWAVYAIGVDGELIGEPEIIEVLFDDAGAATVGSPATRVRVEGMSEVDVETTETTAAYVGIAELSGDVLVADPDLSILDAAAYATFQELDLDAIVALEAYRTRVDGTVDVGGLRVDAKGVVQGGEELRWDLTFSDVVACGRVGTCATTVASASYLAPVGKVKAKTGAAPRVTLKPGDAVFDRYDAELTLTVDADLRGFEVAAGLDVGDAGSDVQALEPGELEVVAIEHKDTEGYLIYGDALFSVAVVDSAGGLVSVHDCALEPTAAGGTREVYVGECTRSDAGTRVDRLLVSVDTDGGVAWSVDLSGAAFTSERPGGVCASRVCPEGAGEAVTVAGGRVELAVDDVPFDSAALSVTGTSYVLPFSFAEDVGSRDAALDVLLYGPDGVSWTETDGVVTASAGDRAIATFDLDDVTVAGTGFYLTKGDGWQAVDATPQEGTSGPSEGPFELSFSSGQFTRMNAQCTTYR